MDGGIASRLTGDGPTRIHIVETAAELICRQGVADTSIEQVVSISGVGPERFHRHFPDKESVVAAAVEHQARALVRHQADALSRVHTRRDLMDWATVIVDVARSRLGPNGCSIGSLVRQLADHSDHMRAQLDDAFRGWESHLACALARIQTNGEIDQGTNVFDTAIGILATVQGGLLLAQAADDDRRLRAALEVAISCINGSPITRASRHE